jgi:hypothetical protein
MKKSEIKLGKQYSNGKGTIRKIIGFGPYVLYGGQTDTDCVRYRIMTKIAGPQPVGSEQNCTRRSFISWVKEEV